MSTRQETFGFSEDLVGCELPPSTGYAPGDKVSLARWDKTEPPRKRLGVCTVVDVETGCVCESGEMVTVQSEDGRQVTLDAHWLAHNEKISGCGRERAAQAGETL